MQYNRDVSKGFFPTFLPVIWTCVSLLAADSSQIRYLNFTARDENRIYLRDVKREEVLLLIDQKGVPVRYLGYKDVDTAYLFLIENSPRTAPYGKSIPHLGQVNIFDQIRYFLMNGFFSSVVETGPVMIAEFYQEWEVVHDFSSQADALEYALYRMQPHFSGLDKENIPIGRMVGRGVDVLKERSVRRKILVLFTTTVDRESYKYLEEYRELLLLSDVDLYVVSFAPRSPRGFGYTFEQRMNGYFFRQLAGATAGKLYLSGEHVYVHEFMDDLMSRLSNSYTIGFYVETGEPRREHDVQLNVRSKEIEVSHREKMVY